MRKIIISLILILSILFLSSCSLGLGASSLVGGSRTERLDESNDEEVANAHLEQMLEAIKNKDKDALKALFSKNALGEAEDFDGSVNDLLEFFQGEVVSWEKLSGPTVFESNEHGHVKKNVSSYYHVNTDKQKYFFLVEDYSVDTDNPDNVGLYLLLVVKAEDEAKVADGDQKIIFDGKERIPHFGIYLPIK